MSFMKEIKKIINSKFVRDSNLPGALYALDNIEDETLKAYSDKLDNALKDDRVTNIAISAPYGVGKSSVLLSYFKANRDKYNWYIVIYNWFIRAVNFFKSKFIFSSNIINEKDNYQFVNLPNFFYEEGNIKSSGLQKEIVKQLLSTVSSHGYPYSKIKRIQDRGFFVDSVLLIIFLFMIYSILYGFGIVPDPELLREEIVNLVSNNFLFSIVSIITLILIWEFLVQTFRQVKSIFSKSTFSVSSSNFSFQSNNVETKDEVEIFNLYQEEIMYYFRKSKVKVVVFEDLDRFENPEIFQDLRELNININKRNGRVVFIYSLRDSVFNQLEDAVKTNKDKINKEEKAINPIDESDALLKSKFFDYVIPIFPVQDYENTGKSFLNELKHHFGVDKDFLKDESFEFFIEDLGIYIKDLRTIKLIINEFKVYYDSLKNIDEQSVENIEDIIQILSMVIYKNIYSADFEKITTNESLLNGIFNYRSNLIQLLNNKKVNQIDNQINELEENIDALSHTYIQDIEKTLEGYYKQLWNDTFGVNYHSSFNFILDGESYSYEEGLNFYRKLVKLPKEAVIETRGKSRRDLTVSKALNYKGESIASLISYLDKDNVEPILREQTLLYIKLDNLKEERRNSYVTVINKSTGEIILELEGLIEDLAIEINDNSRNPIHKKFQKAYNTFKKHHLLRFLIFNNYINDNYKKYISKVSYNLSNEEDKRILQLIRSYNKDFSEDYKLESPAYIDYYLSRRPSSYYYAYSSDLLLYLSQFSNNERKIEDILSNDIINNKYQLVTNAVSTALEDNSSLLSLIKYIWNISPRYLTDYQKENNTEDMHIESLIKTVFNDFYSFWSEKNNSELINFIISSVQYQPEKTLNVLLEMNDNQNFIENDLISKHRNCFIFKDLENINADYYEIIFINGFYAPTPRNFNIFKNYYSIEYIFEDFYRIFLKMSDKLVIDYKAFFDYVIGKYMDNVKESYFGFKKFIENVTGLDEDLENEYNNISTENIGGKNELLDYFININLAEVNVDKNREIIKLIGDEFKFSTEQMKELIKTKRLYYDADFWQQSIQNKLLKEYIIMCMTIDQGVFQDAFENLNVSLSLISKLEMIYLAEEEKLIKMIISKQDSKSGEELNKISEPNLHVISNKILNINPTKSFLLRLLTEIPYNAVKSDILGYLLDNSDKLDINSKELDTALDTTIFSKTYKKGTEYLSFEKYNVSKELINVLEERDLAIKRNNAEFSLKAALSKLVKIV